MMDDIVKQHNLFLKNREQLDIVGIKKIESLNETEFILDTVMGFISIYGTSLEMANLNIDSGEISITGKINSIKYHDSKKEEKKKEGIFTKLFK